MKYKTTNIMNREILFRGLKADGSNEWVYGNLLQSEITVNDTSRCAITEKFADDYSLKVHEVIPSTVGQFCGLTDKNGTRIFEGDWIFYCAGYTSKVDFKDGMFISVYSHPEDGEEIPLDDLGTSIEVIGNIHQDN